jgi:hypothetical protein
METTAQTVIRSAPGAPPSKLAEAPEPSAEAAALAGYVIEPTAAIMESVHRLLVRKVARLLDTLSTPEACAAELKARRALEILAPDVERVFVDERGAYRVEDLEPGLRQEVEAAIERSRGGWPH